MFRLLVISFALLLGACTTSNIEDAVTLPSKATVALMPIVNNSQTPLAGERAESILASLWYQKQLPTLSVYPPQSLGEFSILNDQVRITKANKWLATQKVDYVLRGSIEEWRYKAGLDGEPVVSITLSLFETGNSTPVWTGTVAKSGWGHDSLASTAQIVLRKLVNEVEVDRR